MADVFISYKREDRRVAERLSGTLQQLGFDVWWDFELLSGENFRAAIRAVMDQCKAAVVVWSKAATESSFVLDEASYALRLGRLCPLRIEAVDLPFGFGQIHAEDLSDWNGELSHSGFQNVVRSIEERVGRKAMFGSLVRSQEKQAAAAELEAFKVAELAGAVGALRTFAANYPSGAFAAFVRDQIEQSARESAARPRGRTASTTGAKRPAVNLAIDAAPRRRPSWQVATAVAALLVILVGVYTQWNAARQADVVRARERADELLVAEKHTRELEARANADRAARERAETDRLAAEKRAQAAEAKVQLAQKPVTPAAVSDSKRPSADPSFAFEALSRELQAAAQAARAMEKRAEDKVRLARMAVDAAETAANRARAKEPGTIAFDLNGVSYLGEGRAPIAGGSRGPSREGSGVTTYLTPGEWAGDRHAGQYKDNARNGLGIYEYGSNTKNPNRNLRFEGEFAGNRHSLGRMTYLSGAKVAGLWRDGLIDGAAVSTGADGSRYEGEFQAGKRNGRGVVLSADGRVQSAGLWKDGKLDAPFKP